MRPNIQALVPGHRLNSARRPSALVRSQAERTETADAASIGAQEYPSYFFEPFVRSFVLGLSTGIVFELVHSAKKLCDLVGKVGVNDLVQVLPQARDNFVPVVVDDHLVALGCWLLFYAIEAYAIIKVLEQHAQNPEELDQNLRTMWTLPRMMLPRFRIFQGALNALGFRTSATLTPVLQAPESTLPRGRSLTKPVTKPKKMPPILDPQQEPEGPAPGVDESASGKDRLGKLQDRRVKAGLLPGQLDTSTAEILRRQKELKSRRMYLQNFWYAAALAETVKEKPVGVEILGEKVVLFRDGSGKVQCLHDVCPHRGAPLHLGWRSEVGGHDCVVCPYHGWAFDGEGHLRDVPASESSGEWPQKPLVDSFPVEEKGGFIWLFYGSKRLPADERPPIPYVPELNDPAWRPVYGEIEFECNHWSVFENAIDMAHIHYLHSDSFGNQDQPEIRDMQCASGAFGIEASFGLHNKPVNALWEFAKVPEVKVNAKALLPSTSVIGFTLGQGLSFITFVNTVPISATRTVNRFALIRRLDVDRVGSYVFNMPAWDRAARSAMMKILTQDKAMVERLEPEMLGREISIKADLPQMAFRKLRQQYIDMGYGVAPERSLLAPRQVDM